MGTLAMKPLTILTATMTIALPLIETHLETHSAQAQIPQPRKSHAQRKRDVLRPTVGHRTLHSQNAKKRTRYNTTRMRPTPPLPKAVLQAAPQPLPTLPPSAVRTTYDYSAGIDRPICFIERSDGGFLDLSQLCGMKSKDDPTNPNFNASRNTTNNTMLSYPIYPEDR
jgi:hypothetical protein